MRIANPTLRLRLQGHKLVPEEISRSWRSDATKNNSLGVVRLLIKSLEMQGVVLLVLCLDCLLKREVVVALLKRLKVYVLVVHIEGLALARHLSKHAACAAFFGLDRARLLRSFVAASRYCHG